MTTTLVLISGQTSFTAQNYKILPDPGTAVPDNLVNTILSAAQTAGVVLASSPGVGVVIVPARRFVGTGVGSPTSGDWQLGDELVDSTGAEFECIGAGSPGVWVAAGTAETVVVDGGTP